MIDELLDSKETAKAFHSSIHTIRAWTVQGRLPVVRLGRKVLFRKQDIERIIEHGLPKGKFQKRNEGAMGTKSVGKP